VKYFWAGFVSQKSAVGEVLFTEKTDIRLESTTATKDVSPVKSYSTEHEVAGWDTNIERDLRDALDKAHKEWVKRYEGKK
jgi:hypothetical protein